MPTLSAGGLVSGIDTDAVVAKLKAAESGSLTKLQAQRSDRNLEASNLGTLASKLRTLQDLAKALETPTKFLANAGTSTTTSVGITADGNAEAGTYGVKVTALAKASRGYSTPMSARDQNGLFGTGTLTIGVGTASADIAVTSDDTLDSVAAKINGAGLGAKANVFYDGTNYRLSVNGTQTGAANNVTFTETGTTFGLANTTTAQNAALEIDGFVVSSATNTVSTAIKGVTLDLKALTTETDATVSVAADPSGGVAKMKEFVTAYNAVVAQIKAFTTTAGKSSDGTALSIQTRLRATVSQPVEGMGSAIASLAQLGVATQKDGTLLLNDTTLTKALKDSPDAVMKALSVNNGAQIGVARRVDSVLTTLLDAQSGAVTTRQAGLAKRIRTMDEQITKQQARLDAFESRTRKQFNAMETSLANLQAIQGGSFFTTG